MSKINSETDIISPWIQNIISSNLSWDCPIDRYIKHSVDRILNNDEEHAKLMNKADRLFSKQSKNEKDLKKWIITHEEYIAKKENIIQKLDKIRSMLESWI